MARSSLTNEGARIAHQNRAARARSNEFDAGVFASIARGDGDWPPEWGIAIAADRGHPASLEHMGVHGLKVNEAISRSLGGGAVKGVA